MLEINIELDASDLQKRLEEHRVNTKNIAKKMMQKVFGEMRNEIRKRPLSGAVLKKRSGALRNSLNYYAFPDMSGVIVSRNHSATYHEHGPTHILPKKDKYLTFKINGEWKKMERVTLPKREFMRPTFEGHMNDGTAEKTMEKVLQQELDKIYGQ